MSNPSANPTLYGPARLKNKPIPISHSSIHSLSTELALAKANRHKNKNDSSSTATPTSRRSRGGEKTAALFRSSNKGVSERALKDLQGQSGGSGSGGGSATGMGLTSDELARSKRKMEEKAKLYDALRRGGDVGTLLPGSKKRRKNNIYDDDDDDDNNDDDQLIDFNRKWADEQKKKAQEAKTSDNTDADDTDSSFEASDIEDLEERATNAVAWGASPSTASEEMVEYTDEFGRTRTAPKSLASKITAKLASKAERLEEDRNGNQEEDNLIYGNVIQTHAFTTLSHNSLPEHITAPEPKDLEAEEAHYLASNEIRTKGVGFYAFSGDSADRKREMEELEKVRKQTEEERERRAESRMRRKEAIEKRKAEIRKLRMKKVGERWLEGFMGELGMGPMGAAHGAKSETV
ncbi:hypothetical protein DFH27DRAFT_551395 [Peziza echinospora]|nr:hypothetical protein DFH27DRAFT_551395 [Peziza echinospora]